MRMADALTHRIDQARLLHWQPGRRVTVDIAGKSAVLTMSWLAADGTAMIPSDPSDPTVIGSHVARLDGDLPRGVTAQGWSALPDTADAIAAPTEADIAAAARYLGATHYERLDYPDGRTTWRMVGVGTACMTDRLRRCGEALYGERWQSDLARALGVGDRRVREWMAGDRRVPSGVWSDIAGLLDHRRLAVLSLMREIETSC